MRQKRNFKTEERVDELLKTKDLLKNYDCKPAFDNKNEENELIKRITLLLMFSEWSEAELQQYNVIIMKANILISEKNQRRRENLNCNFEKKASCECVLC